MTYHSAKRYGSGRMVVNSDEVDKEGCATDQHRQQEGTQDHLLNPDLS